MRPLKRLVLMGPEELAGRSLQEVRKARDRFLSPETRFRSRLAESGSAGQAPLPGLRDLTASTDWCMANFPEASAACIEDADRILHGEVPLLGHGWVHVALLPIGGVIRSRDVFRRESPGAASISSTRMWWATARRPGS